MCLGCEAQHQTRLVRGRARGQEDATSVADLHKRNSSAGKEDVKRNEEKNS